MSETKVVQVIENLYFFIEYGFCLIHLANPTVKADMFLSVCLSLFSKLSKT